jgi:hypothetical protein
MARTQISKPKIDKPFLAARIPYGLEQALETHVKSTNESKTQTIIKALSAYLKWSDEGSSPNASDRLSRLEKKVAKLEELLKTPKQTSFLDAVSVIKKDIIDDNNTENHSSVITENISNDNKEIIQDSKLDKVSSARLLTHKELSELTGISNNSIKAKPRSKNKVIKWKGRSFEVIQVEEKWRWKEAFDNK